MYESDVKIAERAVIELFRYLDHSRQGYASVDRLLDLIKGPMSDYRRKVVIQIFEKLDFEGKGLLNIDDFPFYYSSSRHPLVLSGVRHESQIAEELVRSFEDYLAILVKPVN